MEHFPELKEHSAKCDLSWQLPLLCLLFHGSDCQSYTPSEELGGNDGAKPRALHKQPPPLEPQLSVLEALL